MPKLPEPITALLADLRGDDFAIATAVLAYATGDAFGVAYEFEPRVNQVPRVMLGKADWPAGGVSDDTLLSLMTISCLAAASPSLASKMFLEKLSAASSTLRGLGPTTRHALGIFVEEREVGIIGTTNGGMMRTALLSLAFRDRELRQSWVSELCSATHFKSEALSVALVMAELFDATLDKADLLKVFEKTVENLDLPNELKSRLLATFEFPKAGISLNPVESLLAVLKIATEAETVWQAYEAAIRAGGDTDTIAALSSALVALRNPESFYELEFISDVNWQEIPELSDRITQLLESRNR